MESKLRLGIIGATGRLGTSIARLALNSEHFQLTAALTHSNSSHLGKDYGTLLGTSPLDLPISTAPPPLDLLIDASLPTALAQNLQTALHLNIPLVVGTTGHTDPTALRDTAQHIPIFYTPNFSLGVALLHHLAATIARYFPGAHIDLIETHHAQKKDIPSGTALSLAHALQLDPSRIHSLRSGLTVGKHQLLFNTPLEQLTLTHTAHTRDAFASGALVAARFLAAQPPGLYSMDDVLNTSNA